MAGSIEARGELPRWLGWVALASVCVLAPSTALAKETQPLNVSKALVQPDLDSPAKPADWVKLSSEKVTLEDGDTLPKLLARKRFVVDGETLGVVYDLNPQASADSIRPGTELVVPVVMKDARLEKELEAGFRLQLTTHLEQKRTFLQKLKKLQRSTESVGKSKTLDRAPPADRERFVRSTQLILDQLAIFKTVIVERSRPLNAEVLEQLNAEADMIDALLNDLTVSKRALTKADLDKVELVAADVKLKAKPFGEKKGEGELPGRWPEVRVVVRTVDPNKSAEVHNLRVFYVPLALYGDPKFARSFDRLTSPAARAIPEADYYIWASRPSESKLVTERKILEVRVVQGKEAIEVDLAVQ